MLILLLGRGPMKARRTALVAAFTALSVASAYATSTIPNVTLMDLVVFIAGWLMGSGHGALVGVLSWAIYGAVNPYGFSLPIWLATMSAEALYGAVGGVCRRFMAELGAKEALMLGAIGFMATFTYDVATNAVFALVFDVPILVAIAMGAPFALLHEGGNFVLFSSLAPPLLRALSRVVGGGSCREPGGL